MMSGHGANPIFFNKKKGWTSRALANLPPPTSNNISFLSYPTLPPLPEDGCHMCITPKQRSSPFNASYNITYYGINSVHFRGSLI